MTDAVSYARWLKENEGQEGTPEFEKVAQAYKVARVRELGREGQVEKRPTPFATSGSKEQPTAMDAFLGFPYTRGVSSFALGAAKPIVAATQMAGMPFSTTEVEKKLRGKPELWGEANEAVGDVLATAGEFGGQVFSPINRALGAIAIPMKSKLTTVGQGFALGAAGGLLSEVKDPEEADFWNTKATQAVGGATFGTIFSAAVAAGGPALAHAYYNWIEPALANTSTSVREAVKRRMIAASAGDRGRELREALLNPREFVPGSAPTAGQAAVPANAPAFAALAASAAKVDPVRYGQRADEQAHAVLDSLQTFGKTPQALEDAIKARGAQADELYNLVRRDRGQRVWAHVDPSASPDKAQILTPNVRPVVAYIDRLMRENTGNPDLMGVLASARKGLVTETGVQTNPANLMSVLDGIEQALERKHTPYAYAQLGLIKRRIEAQLPRLQVADRVFETASKPISNMQVGQELEDVATRSHTWRAGTGERLDEKGTVEAITKGFGRRNADLTEDAKQRIGQIKEEFLRNSALERQARAGAPIMPEMKQGSTMVNPLQREVMVMNAILRRLEGRVSEKVAAELALDMLYPARVASMLEQGTARRAQLDARADMLQRAWRYGLPGAVQQGAQATE